MPWKETYEEYCLDGLKDKSRAPNHTPHEVSEEIVFRILRCRHEHKTWGPRKFLAYLEPRFKSITVSESFTVNRRYNIT